MASAILAGRVDYVRATDPVTTRKAKTTPGMSTATYYQSVVHATWVNNKKKPLDDPRVGAVAVCVGIDCAFSGWLRILDQAARSIGFSVSFWVRVCHPSTLRIVI
jgi:hypothetical protein